MVDSDGDSAYDLIWDETDLLKMVYSRDSTTISETLFKAVSDKRDKHFNPINELVLEGADLSYHGRIWVPERGEYIVGNALDAAEQRGHVEFTDSLRSWFCQERCPGASNVDADELDPSCDSASP